jgi:hypothetical protein
MTATPSSAASARISDCDSGGRVPTGPVLVIVVLSHAPTSIGIEENGIAPEDMVQLTIWQTGIATAIKPTTSIIVSESLRMFRPDATEPL